MVTASQTLNVTPSGAYSWRAPSPPHIDIPAMKKDRSRDLKYCGSSESDSREDHEILREIAQGNHEVDRKDWKYESRREAQAILSYLYLGPSSAARDVDFLREKGITMLLVIRDTTTASFFSGRKAARELGIVSESIDVQGNLELIRAFPRAIKIINDHLIQSYHAMNASVQSSSSPGFLPACGKVLVWCESGNERSVATVAAFLMATYDFDFMEAIQHIQSRRFCIALDDGIKHTLLSYNQLLQARRSVSTASVVRMKRSRDEVEDDLDVEMDVGMLDDDSLRFEGRHFAPFS